MSKTGSTKSTNFWPNIVVIIAAIITAVGAFYGGVGSKDREISATKTA